MQTKRSALLEAVEVVTDGFTFTTAATITRFAAKIAKADKNPYSTNNAARSPFARPEEKSERVHSPSNCAAAGAELAAALCKVVGPGS